MKLTPEQEQALKAVVATEPPVRSVKEIREVLSELRCPTCNCGLIFGGESSVFRFVDLGDLESGWQDGKDKSEGNHFMCARNERHSVHSALPDFDQDICDYLSTL